jgi:opacity protein-like surface antigen
LGGVIYSLTEKIDLDLGYKYGITRPEVDHTMLAGITIKF